MDFDDIITIMEKKEVRIATRDSLLALAQANIVKDYIERAGYKAILVPMKTKGDKILDKNLYEIGGKGLFLLELEEALSQGEVDICVHSLKDMPVDMPKEFPLVGVSYREDERDVLILPEGTDTWDKSKPLGCSSRRRSHFIKKLFPDITIEGIRGNINTRLRKLDEGQFGALILAAAGIKRLGLDYRINRFFDTDEIIPSAGQGVLGIQARAGEALPYLEGFFDRDTFVKIRAERAFVRAMGGDCTAPVAAHAKMLGSEICLTGWFITEDGRELSGHLSGHPSEPEALGEELAESLLSSNQR